MPDLLDRINAELTTRLDQLRPLVFEHDRLQAALSALSEMEGPTPKPPASTFSGTRRRRAEKNKTPASARPRQRAPRGANREAVLRAVRERPGATAAELAAVSGVGRTTLNSLLAGLVREGEIEKRQLPTGRRGYALATTPPDEPTPPAPAHVEPTETEPTTEAPADAPLADAEPGTEEASALPPADAEATDHEVPNLEPADAPLAHAEPTDQANTPPSDRATE